MSTIPRLSGRRLEGMRRAGTAAAETLQRAVAAARAGVSTKDIDTLVADDTRRRGGRCAPYLVRVPGAPPFPGHLCTSRNAVVCHGIPSGSERLEPGDIVNLDVTTELGGWHGDTSRTVAIGRVSAEAHHVMHVAERALALGIEAVHPGRPFGVIGQTIERFVTAEGCSVVRELGGHGIGRRMHQAPHVFHHAVSEPTPVMRPGMCFTIEPMVCLGSPEIRVLADGWTVVTADGRLSAQFEHTICVTSDGAEVLTAAPGSGRR